MELLTAYNADVQRYILGAKSTKTAKEHIIDSIREAVLTAGKSFEKLFPNKTKRKAVMDEIIFYLAAKGICKVAASTLAENTGASIRTVSSAVKALKETGAILVCGLADGHNKYVFVLKSHANFQQIMKEVFFIQDGQAAATTSPENNNIAECIAEQIAERENAESVGTQGIEATFSGSNHYNDINLKQEELVIKQSISQSIENELLAAQDNLKQELQHVHTYYANEYQFRLYYTIKAGDYHKDVVKAASILGLRVGTGCTKENYVHAVKAVLKVSNYLKSGVPVQSIPALFSAKYSECMQVAVSASKAPTKQQESSKHVAKVSFYNWLEDGLQEAPKPFLKAATTLKLGQDHTMQPETKATRLELDELGVF